MNKNTIAAAAVGAIVALAATYAMNSSVFATKGAVSSETGQSSQPPPSATSMSDAAQASSSESVAATPAATPAASAKPRAIVPQGASFGAIVETHISSRTARKGDAVTATTTEDITTGGKVVVPAGTTVVGAVDDVRSAAETRSGAFMRIVFTRLGEHKVRMALVSPDLDARSERANNAADLGLVAGGAITGAVIGHQIDRDKGKEVGAVVGGVTGLLTASNTGANVQLKANERAVIRLNEDLEIY